MDNTLHIISFDIPDPANYGGAIEVFGKIKALYELGVKVKLHCYYSERSPSQKLERYCEKVFYYKRDKGLAQLFSKLPFIVASRNHKELLLNLKADTFPILFDGLHTTFLLSHPELKNRKKAVRCHNVEHNYYESLAQSSTNWLKRLYYKREAKKLANYEKVVKNAGALFTISQNDSKHFEKINKNTFYLAAFHNFQMRTAALNVSNCIYFGNLDVEENQLAIDFLIKVFDDLPYHLDIYGKSQASNQYSDSEKVRFHYNPKAEELETAISASKITCLPTFQDTGIKLKMIQACLQANSILATSQMVPQSLQDYIQIEETIESWRIAIKKIMEQAPNIKQIEERKALAAMLFDNKKGAIILREWFFPAQ